MHTGSTSKTKSRKSRTENRIHIRIPNKQEFAFFRLVGGAILILISRGSGR